MENARKNKHCFLPNAAIFNPGKKFDQGRFWSRTRQPPLSRERVSRNQQNNTKNCNFRHLWSNHLIVNPWAENLTFLLKIIINN